MLNETKDKELFDRIFKAYALKDKYPPSSLPRKQLLLLALKSFLKNKKDLGTVVDIGCGVGAAASYLSGHYSNYIGIDQSAKMMETARRLHQDNKRARFITENIKSIHALQHNSADLILSIGALHHMTELDRVMQSLHGIARNGCTFVAIEPQKGNPIIQFMRYVRGFADPNYSRDQIFFAENQLIGLFRNHNLTDINTSYFGLLSTPFAEMIIRPQNFMLPISRAVTTIDSWIYEHLPPRFCRICFKIIITGRFRKQKH